MFVLLHQLATPEALPRRFASFYETRQWLDVQHGKKPYGPLHMTRRLSAPDLGFLQDLHHGTLYLIERIDLKPWGFAYQPPDYQPAPAAAPAPQSGATKYQPAMDRAIAADILYSSGTPDDLLSCFDFHHLSGSDLGAWWFAQAAASKLGFIARALLTSYFESPAIADLPDTSLQTPATSR